MADDAPTKIEGPGHDPAITAFDGGFTWIAHPEEGMARASHALATDAGVWLVDPVDAAGIDDRIADLGAVAGVICLLARHERHAPRFADRYDVPVSFPPGVDRDLASTVADVGDRLPGTDVEIVSVVDWPGWHEAGLYDGETLVVGDALGTSELYALPDERLGVFPLARLAPPRRLAELTPERVLVGHGTPIVEGASPALETTLATARRRLPRAIVHTIRVLL